jgi:hypothetical protein
MVHAPVEVQQNVSASLTFNVGVFACVDNKRNSWQDRWSLVHSISTHVPPALFNVFMRIPMTSICHQLSCNFCPTADFPAISIP